MKKRLASHVLAALTIASVLLSASCSSTPSTAPTSEAKPGATKPYGELKVGIGGAAYAVLAEPSKVSAFSAHASVVVPIYDSLLDLTAEGQMAPGLAERWEIAPDGTSQTFYIRKGVKFHDGSDVTGADVKFSLERFVGPEATASESAVVRGRVAGVDLKDDYTVVLRLKQPLFEVLSSFTTYLGAGFVLPKKYIEEKGWDYFNQRPVGSGPWKFVKQQAGHSIEYEAVESHWRVVPQFQKLTLLYVPDQATTVAMLKTGELDIAPVPVDSVAGLKAAGLRIINHDGGDQYYQMLFYDLENPKNSAMGDVRVRKALSLSVNRQEMADNIYGGAAKPAVAFYVPKTSYFFDPSVLKPDPYDLEGAKKLLAEAGRPNGFNTKTWDYGGGGLLSILNQGVAGYWRKVGINAEVLAIDFPTFRTRMLPKPAPDIYDTGIGHLSGGGVFQFERMTLYHSTKTTIKNINNAKLDELIDKVPMTADPGEKKKLAQQAAVMAKEEYNDPAFLDAMTPIALGSRVGSFTLTKQMTYLGPAYERATHAK